MDPEFFPTEKAASQNMASLVSSVVIFLSSTHSGNLAFSMFSNTHGFYFPSHFHGHIRGLMYSL